MSVSEGVGGVSMVELFDKYKLDADYYNFKLVKTGFTKEGKPTETIVGYVNDIAHAVRYLYGIESREFVMKLEKDVRLEDLVQEFQRIQKEVIEWGDKTMAQWNKVSKK